MKSKPSRPPIKSVDPGSFTGKHPSEDKQLARNKDRFQGTGRIGEEAARAAGIKLVDEPPVSK